MKKIFAMILTLALALSFAACGNKPASTTEAPPEPDSETENITDSEEDAGEPVNLIFSSVAVPDDAHAQAQDIFKEKLEEISGGNMTVEVYNNSTLFDQDTEKTALLDGDVDIIYNAPTWVANGSPWISMFTAAYLFNDYDHMTEVMDGEIGQGVFEKLKNEQGLVVLGNFYIGSRCMNTRVDLGEVTSTADFNGLVLRVANSDSWLMMGRALGASPTPLAYSELYMALSTGTVDAQENPIPSTYNSKFYEVAPYIYVTNHVTNFTWPCMSAEKWDSLTETQQGWVMEAIAEAKVYCDTENIAREEECLSIMEEEGVKVYYPNIETLASEVLDYYLADGEFTASWDMELFNQIRAMVK